MRFGFYTGNTFVHPQALVLFWNVIYGDTDIQAEIELGFSFIGRGFTLHFADGAIQHLSIELEADGFDMPALFTAKQISRAPQFEIEGGDFEAGPEIREFFQCC